jgi:hypothetical protein
VPPRQQLDHRAIPRRRLESQEPGRRAALGVASWRWASGDVGFSLLGCAALHLRATSDQVAGLRSPLTGGVSPRPHDTPNAGARAGNRRRTFGQA